MLLHSSDGTLILLSNDGARSRAAHVAGPPEPAPPATNSGPVLATLTTGVATSRGGASCVSSGNTVYFGGWLG